jgi:hypothetical protein
MITPRMKYIVKTIKSKEGETIAQDELYTDMRKAYGMDIPGFIALIQEMERREIIGRRGFVVSLGEKVTP